MKIYFKFAAIPIMIFVVLIGIPKLIAFLINSHSDIGIAAIVLIACAIFSVVATKLYNEFFKKDMNNEG